MGAVTNSENGLQLVGSTTSPYVRRLRIYMQDIPHEFVKIDIFNSRDRSSLAIVNPTLKIPMLIDQEQVVLDSGVIQQYIQQKFNLADLNWEQRNLLTSIDSVNDSLVQMFLLSRSEIDTSADKMYFRVQRERYDVVFSHLEEAAKNGAFGHWNYPSISLYCLLDWVQFRNLHDLSAYTFLNQLHHNWHQLAICHQTDPRL